MPSIDEAIVAWAEREFRGATVLTSNTPALNHVMAAVQRLRGEVSSLLSPEAVPAKAIEPDPNPSAST